jgi:thiamine-monophosphate kinase
MLLESGDTIPEDLSEAVRRQHRPTPRLAEARSLAQSGLVTAMIDVSDGLGSDLRRVCEESGVGARVELKRVPVSPLVRYALAHLRIERDPVEVALSGGEDFELLLTASPEHVASLQHLMGELKTPLSVVGQIVEKHGGMMAITEDGAAGQLAEGYTHFQSGEAQP